MTCAGYEVDTLGRLYALFGQAGNRFYTCDPQHLEIGQPAQWQELRALPSGFLAQYGANICHCFIKASWQALIFAVLGRESREFWVYDIFGKTWTRLEDIPIAIGHYGAALEAGGYTFWNGYPCVAIYLFIPPNNFYRYHYPYIPASQTPISWWERLEGPETSGYRYYPDMAYVPHDTLYLLCADYYNPPNTYNLYRYIISMKTWLGRADCKYDIGNGLAFATMGVIGNEYDPRLSSSNPDQDSFLLSFPGHPDYTPRKFVDYHTPSNTWTDEPRDPTRANLKMGMRSDLAYGRWRPSPWRTAGLWTFFGSNTDTFGFFDFYSSAEGGGGQFNSANLSEVSIRITQNGQAKEAKFQLPNCQFEIEVYDNLGKLVFRSSAKGEMVWNYSKVGSGVYFYRIKAKGFSRSGKIIIQN